MNPSRIPTDWFHQAGLVKVGDEKALVPDMPTGIMSLYERVPAEKGLGYYTVSLMLPYRVASARAQPCMLLR